MTDEKQEIHPDDDISTKIQIWAENNKKALTVAGIGLLVIVGGFFAYKYFYVNKRETKAAQILYVGNGTVSEPAFNLFSKDSFRLAMTGDSLSQGRGLVKILNDYGNTEVAPAAMYMMAMGNLHLGKENSANYDNAIKWLDEIPEEFDEEEVLLTTMAIGAKGDALIEKGDLSGALAQYEKAASRKPNVVTTPYFLMKSAMINEQLGNWQAAYEAYQKIVSDYPETYFAEKVAPLLGRAEYKVKH